MKDFKEFLLRGSLVDTAVGLVIAIVTIVPAALAGELSFDWIERPSVRLGRRLEDWMFERSHRQPAIERSLSEGSAP